MNPGDIRMFKKGQRRALVLALGVWAEGRGDWIDIHLTGPADFHTTVTDQTESARYHRTLFRNLRHVLIRQGRWQYGNDGAETEERS